MDEVAVAPQFFPDVTLPGFNELHLAFNFAVL
jgi:hypothetical protein